MFNSAATPCAQVEGGGAEGPVRNTYDILFFGHILSKVKKSRHYSSTQNMTKNDM